MPAIRYTLEKWPYHDYWTGIVFNGEKIGFTHLSVSPAKDQTRKFEIHSEAAFRFRFLMFDKEVVLTSSDLVSADLSLERFVYNYTLDGNRQRLSGRVREGKLEVQTTTRGQIDRKNIPVEERLYPASIIGLYPAFHGLELGRHYQYQVYDGETNSISTVTQQILAYEESDLFSGKAFKVSTRFHGQEVTTWIDAKGRPLLEISLGGVLISGLESEVMAKQHLAQAGINKDETLLNFSLIKTEIPIQEPERVAFMEVALKGIGEELIMPSDEVQQCRKGQGGEVICRIGSKRLSDAKACAKGKPFQTKRYLQPTHTVPSRNDLIRKTAKKITEKAKTPLEQIRLLVQWIQYNIEQEPIDVFTALDVLSERKAECQGHTYLYAAFARAVEIPTRVVNGLVYSKAYGGFLYHTWAESRIDGHWVSVDPTLGQLPVDATHVKIIEGESLADLLPLANLIGRLHVRLITVNGP
ncbi:MAG: transglutaminase domain-containing protein [Desulfobacteraceae bacterium]|nr:transglutaminase domain-containing protein [Desulfobacteraceae bacterium]